MKCIEPYETDKQLLFTCGDGPYYKHYHKRGYLIWPPIKYKTCNNLHCNNHRDCIPIGRYVRFKWANLRKCDELGRGVFVERRLIRFVEEPACQCKCPSFRYCRFGHIWNPIHCKCVSLHCAPMQYFDTNLYKCVDYLTNSPKDEIADNSEAQIP